MVADLIVAYLIVDSIAKPVIDDVLKLISTGSTSDGKIFVYDTHIFYISGLQAPHGISESYEGASTKKEIRIHRSLQIYLR